MIPVSTTCKIVTFFYICKFVNLMSGKQGALGEKEGCFCVQGSIGSSR